MTLQAFIDRYKITATVRRVTSNPYMPDMPGGQYWSITLKSGYAGKFTLPFSQGSAHTAEPTVADVLGCIVADVALVDSSPSFEDWAANLGYDPDSRKAERIYKAINEQIEDLKIWLGDDGFEDLLRTEQE